jgi:hypothetical protein
MLVSSVDCVLGECSGSRVQYVAADQQPSSSERQVHLQENQAPVDACVVECHRKK